MQTINPANVFNALVNWFHDQLVVKQKAPGFLVGLSGTDSLVTFCAAAKALEKAGKPQRMLGVHFAPSDDFLYDHPDAEVHLWFQRQVLPWLRRQHPQAEIVTDTSIDWRCDGLRWGSLLDRSVVVSNDRIRRMLLPEEQYWVLGTRNRTEDVLFNYSNASMAASVQPIIHLWKSEILQLSEYLGIPQIAIDKSCETDCICGRLSLPSRHIQEMDMLLMARDGELDASYVWNNVSPELRRQLESFIEAQIATHDFKSRLPYIPKNSLTSWMGDPLVLAFQEGTLNLKEFNHYKHLYVAWCFLKEMCFEDAVSYYCYALRALLDANGQSHRYNVPVTRSYFEMLAEGIKQYPMSSFDEMMEKTGILNKRLPIPKTSA